MKATKVSKLVESTHGELVHGEATAMVQSVSTDTRSIPENCAFFALKGDRFDAHDFLDKALENGAKVLVVSRVPDTLTDDQLSGVVIVKVGDTLTALQQFAAWYRKDLDITVIGITGSNGKTSTKDFAKSVLAVKYNITATVGNLNNHIGLPLSVLATEPEHEVCIWEMGMNHPGEIAPLCVIAHPDIGIITNVGTAHIEHMGNVEAIAEEKGELSKSLPESGTFIVSAACDYIEYFSQRTQARTLIVGNGRGTVRADNLIMSPSGSKFDLIVADQAPVTVNLPVVGRHMVANALLAAGAGYTLDMTAEEIAQGLNSSELTSGRLRCFESEGVTIFDDTYNANPESMAAAIDTLTEINEAGLEIGERYVVLGQMAEQGIHAEQAHRDVGKLAARRGLHVVSVGGEAKGIHEGAVEGGADSHHFETTEEAAEWLKNVCKSGDVVLFKGSRAAGMERVMNQVFSN